MDDPIAYPKKAGIIDIDHAFVKSCINTLRNIYHAPISLSRTVYGMI
jgi:hypothetical protein